MTAVSITIRTAKAEDVQAMAALCGQLGYPAAPEAVQNRLAQILGLENHAVYVAEHGEAGVVGWVHVYISYLLERDSEAEIGGLVVSEAHRRGGAGKLLMQHAEQWTCQHGGQAVCLRSNLIREGAHAFYRQIGYQAIKTSLTFRKVLPRAET
jgi:GNAT superfamily N-acetyltransferase